MRCHRENRLAWAVWVGVFATMTISVSPGYAQTPVQLETACERAGGATRVCVAAAIGAEALHSQVGLLAGIGAEVPGTATTLGTRVGGGPRIGFSVGLGFVKMSFPDLTDPLVTREAGAMASSVQGRVVAGIFEGFRLMPTVGGFLSLDVIGQGSLFFLPENEGISQALHSYSAALRLGILREGFTVPGISVSVAKRFPDDLEYLGTGSPGVISLAPKVTAYRATVGKDIYALEWSAGIGFEEYVSDVTLDVLKSRGVDGYARATGPIRSDRFIYFGSASTTIGILLNLALEVGWAEGFDSPMSWGGPHDPSSGTLFGGLSVRVTM